MAEAVKTTPRYKRAPLKRRTDRARCWASMRMLRRFTMPDLMTTAEITKVNAQKYLSTLRRSGYVRLITPASSKKGGHAVYFLVRNTGPRQPMVRNDGTVSDLNTGETFAIAAELPGATP